MLYMYNSALTILSDFNRKSTMDTLWLESFSENLNYLSSYIIVENCVFTKSVSLERPLKNLALLLDHLVDVPLHTLPVLDSCL
jgi:hypothetical protein